MTRKHFRALAEALKESKADYHTCYGIGLVCASNNPRFEMFKFLEACGVAT